MNTIKPTIVVFGCTGAVGSEVMRQLNNQGYIVRGVLRNPDREYPIKLNKQCTNVSYISADLKSKSQLKHACKKADILFLLTGTSPDQVENEVNIINMAIETGITRIVKLSAPVIPSDIKVEVSNWHREIEERLAKSSIDYCCLRPHSFMQNWERNTFTIRRFGKIFGAMGNASRNYIDCRDIAEIAVHYLISNRALHKKSVILSGPEAITNYDMAERLSFVTNSKIEYINISSEEFYHTLTTRAKLPKWLARHIVELDELAINVTEPTTDTVEKILNRKPRIMNTYLQESRHLYTKKPIWGFWNK
ncbi:NmrA family NAD(P)-binding protein [Aquimarina megaterium]|uniref:NmrA family NAD(P)-binding protein n=2 Tax=Aquimarina TaxID=290174 RepID=UPI00094275DA|nr:NmrA family NAD(P)-binding protein [Aquimarina megaterium]